MEPRLCIYGRSGFGRLRRVATSTYNGNPAAVRDLLQQAVDAGQITEPGHYVVVAWIGNDGPEGVWYYSVDRPAGLVVRER